MFPFNFPLKYFREIKKEKLERNGLAVSLKMKLLSIFTQLVNTCLSRQYGHYFTVVAIALNYNHANNILKQIFYQTFVSPRVNWSVILVISMVYTSCLKSCHQQLKDFRKLGNIRKKQLKNFRKLENIIKISKPVFLPNRELPKNRHWTLLAVR